VQLGGSDGAIYRRKIGAVERKNLHILTEISHIEGRDFYPLLLEVGKGVRRAKSSSESIADEVVYTPMQTKRNTAAIAGYGCFLMPLSLF
jgi:hypothetical protein